MTKSYEEWGFELIETICADKRVDAELKVQEIKCVLDKNGPYLVNFEDGDEAKEAWEGEYEALLASQ